MPDRGGGVALAAGYSHAYPVSSSQSVGPLFTLEEATTLTEVGAEVAAQEGKSLTPEAAEDLAAAAAHIRSALGC